MKQDTYEVVCWPEIQFLFGEDGFEQNAQCWPGKDSGGKIRI